MKFGILGPLTVRDDRGRSIDPGGLRQRRILAALLLRANHAVPVAELVAAAWDGEPPATADKQVRNRVATLRPVLSRAGVFVETLDAGYRLPVPASDLDLTAFGELVRVGHADADPDSLRAALDLWRGPALDGLGGVFLARAAAELDDRRLGVVEDWAELEIAAGRYLGIRAELTSAVTANPLRERLVGLLMRALERDDRAGAALAAYESLAERLDELGLVPTSELRRRYESIKRNRVPAPSQLPAPAAGFTGRDSELTRLDRLLADRPPVIAITGTAGVGKTSLAVGWAHRIRDRFPDGQLYVNLRGYAAVTPVPPLHALSAFLRALGVPPERVPSDLDAAGALYRERLADRRVLVVLDNAASAAQIAPLLPGGSENLTIVTSRDHIADRHGLRLDVLPAGDARELLVRMLGAERAGAEPDALAEMATLCAYLPLALRIAAANIGDADKVAEYLDRLGAGDRLTALAVEGDRQAAVRAAFDLSYAALPEPVQRMFRLLGCHPGPDLTAAAAASLAAVSVQTAAALLDRLAAASLINEQAPGRYGFHDLLRAYAAELAEPDPEAGAARLRVLDHYLHTAERAARRIDPVFVVTALPSAAPGTAAEDLADAGRAMAWFGAEHPVLMAMFGEAVRDGFDAHVWHLAHCLWAFLDRRGHWLDWLAVERAGLAAATRLGDPAAEADSHLRLGLVRGQTTDHDGAVADFQRAFEIYRELGDLRGQGKVAYNLAWLASLHDGYVAMGEHGRRSYDLFQAAGEPGRAAWAMHAVVASQVGLGEFEAAAATGREVLPQLAAAGIHIAEASMYVTMAEVYAGLGRYAEAVASAERGIAIERRLGERFLLGLGLKRLGLVRRDMGEPDAAGRIWHEAIEILDELGHPEGDQVRVLLQSLST